MKTDNDKNSNIDLSQYFDQRKELQPMKGSLAGNRAIEDAKKRKYLVAVIMGNFILGIIFFTYLISKSNEVNSTAVTTLDQFGPPINYQLKPGEIYRLPLP